MRDKATCSAKAIPAADIPVLHSHERLTSAAASGDEAHRVRLAKDGILTALCYAQVRIWLFTELTLVPRRLLIGCRGKSDIVLETHRPPLMTRCLRPRCYQWSPIGSCPRELRPTKCGDRKLARSLQSEYRSAPNPVISASHATVGSFVSYEA